jgi:hypothetical protein
MGTSHDIAANLREGLSGLEVRPVTAERRSTAKSVWQGPQPANPARHEAPAGQYAIRQEELEALHALNQRQKEIDTDRAALRRGILDRLKQGGEIEPGRLRATRREADHCQPTLVNLRSLFGDEFIRDLRRRIAPRKYVTLTIWEPREGR